MSTTLLSAFYDIDFLCKTEKSLTNLSSMLDKKAVGTPVTPPSSSFAPGFLRRHSTSNLPALAGGSKFPSPTGSSSSSTTSSSSSSSSFGSLKETGSGGGGSSSPTALLNKENKFRDRSFSENGERSQHLMQQLQQQQQQQAAAAAGKGGGSGGGGGGAPINSTRYKTELCRPFEESGACKYGEKCQFAHGFHELRSLTRHPKYKTELCRTFHTIGFCPYGPRCHFIHNADERRPAPGGGTAAPPAAAAAAPAAGPHHHPHHAPPHPAGSTGDLRASAARRGLPAAPRLAALQLPAPPPPLRVARLRRAAQPPGLPLRPGELPERLPQLRLPQRLRVAQPGLGPPPAHLQPPLHLRRLGRPGGRGPGRRRPAPPLPSK